jgi:general secretion pathway protein B
VSFILDALKKSETDRQQQGSSEFTSVPVSPQAPSVPRWLWFVGILLAINLMVLIGLLLRPDPVPPPQAPLSVASTAALPTTTVNTAQPSFEEQVASAQMNRPDQQPGPDQQPNRPVVETKKSTANLVEPVLISQDPSSVRASDLHPTLQEVRVRGSINLAELHLDIHVYSAKPDDRFVFINMSKLREGSTLTEGPVVEKITPDGVVLRHQGQVFLLQRE